MLKECVPLPFSWRILYHILGVDGETNEKSGISPSGKRYRDIGKPRAVFAGLEGLAAKILTVIDATSPRKQIKLHLQVACLLSWALPTAPHPERRRIDATSHLLTIQGAAEAAPAFLAMESLASHSRHSVVGSGHLRYIMRQHFHT